MAAESIIGRQAEQKRLAEILGSREAELVALYGRRRVGKTFLVREFFAGHTYFEVTGEKEQSSKVQIARFCHETARVFFGGRPLPPCESWAAAFELLAGAVEDHVKRHPHTPVIVFLDELPWLATHRSGLMGALDHTWNARLSKIKALRMILCGSAAAWMLDKLVFAKGGLYNRITQRIELRPFLLGESSAFLSARGIHLSRRQMSLLYMAVGGIPHYLRQVRRGRSAAQAIGDLCFGRDGLLRDEFPNLFGSLFSAADAHMEIVRALASHASGLSQEEIVARTGLSGGGRLRTYLRELEASGFVAAFTPFAKKKKDTLYKLSDEYSSFYLKWVDRAPALALRGNGARYWQGMVGSPAFHAWAGFAFERLCMKHIDQILTALDLEMIGTHPATWRHVPKAIRGRASGSARGAQIDLLLDRDDDTITVCEMKYTDQPLSIDRKYARELREKLEVFESATGTKKTVQLALVCSSGFKPNAYSEDLVTQIVSLDALFR
jgi:uncharacterized protein